MKEILPLTGLRFIAALYVFLFHIHLRWPLTYQRFLKNILDQGAIGMSIFFMLSGFVLAYRYGNKSISLKNYLINRFARIYPVYAVAAILTLPWIGIDFGNGLMDISKGIVQMLLLVFANIVMIQAWFPQFFSLWNDGGSWSISVEAFCYLFLPFFLPWLMRLSPKQLYLMIFLCWVLATLPGLSAALFPNPYSGIFYSIPFYRLPEFLLGSCLCLAIRLKSFLILEKIGLQIIVLLIFWLYLGFCGSYMPLYVGHNWISVPIIAVIIFALAQNKGFITVLLSKPLLVWLGKISYCFYSFQVVILLFLASYHEKLIEICPMLANNRLLGAASLIVLILLSAAGYYLIEEPARKWIKQYNQGNRILLPVVEHVMKKKLAFNIGREE